MNLIAMLENFLLTQGRSMAMAGVTALLTLFYSHFGVLAKFVTQDQMLSWASVGVGALIVLIIHLFDHNYATPAATPADTAAAASTSGQTGPNASAPAATQSLSSSAQPSAPQQK